jgi:hypothetical protein
MHHIAERCDWCDWRIIQDLRVDTGNDEMLLDEWGNFNN